MNEWIIVFAPAAATLLGAYLGAKIAGEEAVNVVEKQMYLASKKCMKWQLKMLLARCISPLFSVVHQ